ncbi:MAG: glycosyltransferase [Kiritimatiellia bacterium]
MNEKRNYNNSAARRNEIMPFAVTYLIDRPSRSETFIQRELEQLRRRNWTIYTRLLSGGSESLRFAFFSCPEGFRIRFFKAACTRISQEILRNPLTALRIIKRLPQTAFLIKKVSETDSRLIHSQFAGITADLAEIAAKTLGINWTCSVHAHDIFSTSPAQTARRLKNAAAVAACSEEVKNATVEAGIDEDKITLIHHGLPINDFQLNTIRPEEFIFAACRLTEKKGIDSLIRACAVLRDNGLETPCIIAGNGSELIKLKKLCKALDLTDRVLFKGWQSQEEVRNYIRNAVTTVLPSRRTKAGDRDGIANILVEALAIGTPVITTTAGAAGEIIEDGRNGLLVEPDNHIALAKAMTKVIQSGTLRLRMINEGRKTAEDVFDGAANIHKLEKLFEAAILKSLP